MSRGRVLATDIEFHTNRPLDVLLYPGPIIGVSNGLGSVPSLTVWQEVPQPQEPSPPQYWTAPQVQYTLWVLTRRAQAPIPPPADVCAVLLLAHQPHAVYLRKRRGYKDGGLVPA